MDLQTMSREAALRSGVSYDYSVIVPSTAEGMALDFVTGVRDAWRELQEESRNWFFRQKLDQTLAITASDDDYAMPSGLETINYRTVSIYTTAKTDETPVFKMPYEEWRMRKDTVSTAEARPKYIIESPSAGLYLWPVPDQSYTLRFDGVWDIDEMSADTDTPGKVVSGGSTLLPNRYHWILVYDAIRRVALKNEDQQMYTQADERYRAERARLSKRQEPDVYIKAGALTGYSDRSRWVR